MTITEVKEALQKIEVLRFQLPNGTFVPSHFHVTEVGQITKHFIDCGGVVRKEEIANFQLWEANDFEHQLQPEKLLHIIELSENILALPNLAVAVEYQLQDTIGTFHLDFDGTNFVLQSKQTNCLAQDHCGIPPEKLNGNLVEGKTTPTCCTSESNCC